MLKSSLFSPTCPEAAKIAEGPGTRLFPSKAAAVVAG